MSGPCAPGSFRELVRGILGESADTREQWSHQVELLLDWDMLDSRQTSTVGVILTWALLAEGDARAEESQLGALAALSARGRLPAALLDRIVAHLSARDLDPDTAELLADLVENLENASNERSCDPEERAAGYPVGADRLRKLVRGLLAESRSEREIRALTVEVCRTHGKEIDVAEAAVLTATLAWAVFSPDLRSTRPDSLRVLALLAADGLAPVCLIDDVVARADGLQLDLVEKSALDVLAERPAR